MRRAPTSNQTAQDEKKEMTGQAGITHAGDHRARAATCLAFDTKTIDDILERRGSAVLCRNSVAT